jgi:hypothetical protein
MMVDMINKNRIVCRRKPWMIDHLDLQPQTVAVRSEKEEKSTQLHAKRRKVFRKIGPKFLRDNHSVPGMLP